MTQQPAPRVRRKPNYREVTVSRVRKLSPRVVRITVSGDAMEGFCPRGVAEHIRVLMPKPGEDRVVLPEWGPNGPILAPGQERPTSRAYTPRHWDPQANELDIDFILHGEGPGSTWAAKAQPGDNVVVTDPGGPYYVDQDADWYLIAADLAGLPAVGTILEALSPETKALVFVEVPDASEEQPLDSPATFEVTWLHLDGGLAGSKLLPAIKNATLPEGDGRVWVGCEAMAMRGIRQHLLEDRGLEKGRIHTQGYWKQGAVNHPDHDLGDD